MGTAGVVVCVVVLAPVCAPDPPFGHRRACLSNVKQLAVALSIYVVDYDDRLPQANWSNGLREYVKDPNLFSCPEAPRFDFGYAFHRGMIGFSVTRSLSPSTEVVLFESDTNTRNAVGTLKDEVKSGRHRRATWWGMIDERITYRSYVDGHAAPVPK